MAQAYELYLMEKKFPDAMRVALRINERSLTEQCFAACQEPLEKQQLAYLLARQARCPRTHLRLELLNASSPFLWFEE